MQNQRHLVDFNYLLRELKTLDGKAKAIAMVVDREIITNENYVEIRDMYYEMCKKENIEDAINNYYEANNFEVKSAIARKERDSEKANKLDERAIKVYDEGGWYLFAGELTEKIGRDDLALQIYEKAGYFDECARLSEKNGNLKKEAIYTLLARILA